MDHFFRQSNNKYETNPIEVTPCKPKRELTNNQALMRTANCTYAPTAINNNRIPINFTEAVPQWGLTSNIGVGRLSTPPESIKKNQFDDSRQQDLFLNSPIKDSEKKAQYLRDTISKNEDQTGYSDNSSQDIKRNLFKKGKVQNCLELIFHTYYNSYLKYSSIESMPLQFFIYKNFVSNPETTLTLIDVMISTMLNGYNSKLENEFFCFIVRLIINYSIQMLKLQ